MRAVCLCDRVNGLSHRRGQRVSEQEDGRRMAERCHGLRRGRGENDEGEALMANAMTTAAAEQGGMIRNIQNG